MAAPTKRGEGGMGNFLFSSERVAMEEYVDHLVSSVQCGTRKKKRIRKKRELEKEERYRGTPLQSFQRPCRHTKKTYQCESISFENVQVARKNVFAMANKIEQDRRIAAYMRVQPPTRKRQRQAVNPAAQAKPHSMQVTYKFPTSSGPVKVCKTFFLVALGLTSSARRIRTIAETLRKGLTPCENRGGDRVSHKSSALKAKVRHFIGRLRGWGSHYDRKKSKRIYLSSELNVKTLWSMYNNSASKDFQVKQIMFRNIFIEDFNIGFSSPATENCSLCVRLKFQIKNAIGKTRSDAMIEYRIHELRWRAFYRIIKEKPAETFVMCFDMQPVQSLPKLAIQEQFYARQIAYYTVCCLDMNTNTPAFYQWTECDAGCGANEIGSCVYDYLTKNVVDGCKHVRIFADGCGGQNKNSHILHMLFYWFNKAPKSVEDLLIAFPVRGHSFLPADCVFGHVEKKLRRSEQILTPEAYQIIYKDFGKIQWIVQDWKLLDWKQASTTYKQLRGIMEFKRIKISRNKRQVPVLQGEPWYRTNDETQKPQSLFRRGKPNFKPVELLTGNRGIKEIKKKDVSMLLQKRFGENWSDNPLLKWYVNIMNESNNAEGTEEFLFSSYGDCDCCEEDVATRV